MARSAMSLLCRHGRLLIVLVLFAAASSGDAAGDTYDPAKCQPENYTCGGVSVRYPFYLSGAGEVLPEYGESYCGYPGLADLRRRHARPASRPRQLHRVGHQLHHPRRLPRRRRRRHRELSHGRPQRHRPAGRPALLPHLHHRLPLLLPRLLRRAGSRRRPQADHLRRSRRADEEVLRAPGGRRASQGLVVWYCQAVYRAPARRDALPVDAHDPKWRDGGYVKTLREGFLVTWGRSSGSGECSRCEQSNGKCGFNRTGRFFGCLCADGRVENVGCSTISDSAAPPFGDSHIAKRTKLYITASTSSVILICLLFLAFLLGFKKHRYKKVSEKILRIESILEKNGTLNPKRYTYTQMKRMTRCFAEKLGQGGFGAVYRGNLSDGRQIAVKMLKDSKADGEEFVNEVVSISKTSHVNVVTLLGFCLEGSKRALIYDYMPNGSLERYAFNDNTKGGNTLGWEKLFDIAVDIARGLEYLHQGCNTRVVHFDIKPHNILLDQDFCPKISDFGLAKLCLNKESAIYIDGARGTIGYIAPEVYSRQFGAVSSKSDVYSYGMMILEMVGARDKKFNTNSDSSSQYFPQWIYEHLDEYCIGASEINGKIIEIVRKMIVIGLWCIQLSPPNRPTMTRVVEMLEGSTSELELPTKELVLS